MAYLDVDALVVYGYGNEMNARGKKSALSAEVAGVFDPGGIAGVEEGADGEVERALRA